VKHPNRLLDVHELCELIQTKPSWVYRQVSLGKLPYYKCGKYLRFDPREVLEALHASNGAGGGGGGGDNE